MSAKYLVLLLFAFCLVVPVTSALTYNSTFLNGLVAYYDMNSSTDSYTGKYNISNTLIGTMNYTTSEAIYGMSASFNGTGLAVANRGIVGNITSLPCLTTNCTNMTLSFWVYFKTLASYQRIISTDTVGGADTYTLMLQGQDTNRANFVVYNRNINNFISLGANRKYMLTAVKNSTNVVYYLNGTYFNMTAVGTGAIANQMVYLGGTYRGYYSAKGMLDGVVVWNRTLDATEVFTLFNNNGTGIPLYYEGQTTSPPTDTCTYSGSGAWNINCHDNCTISSNVALGGNTLNISGDGGVITLLANITGTGTKFIAGASSTNQCKVYCLGGNCIR